MKNAEVIENLKTLIAELESRRAELAVFPLDDDITISELLDLEDARLDEESKLLMRTSNLRRRLRLRELHEAQQDAVRPLSATRREAFLESLSRVSERIADAEDFDAALSLAARIAKAAKTARENTEVLPA